MNQHILRRHFPHGYRHPAALTFPKRKYSHPHKLVAVLFTVRCNDPVYSGSYIHFRLIGIRNRYLFPRAESPETVSFKAFQGIVFPIG